MATPADPLISQRYAAGTCTLEVEWQPSPLSQWSDRPIASRLSFELWLQTAADARKADFKEEDAEARPLKQVVAQGDRAELQAIAQYIQNQVRSTLALTHISSASPQSRQQQSLQISDPLSHLQLCDIHTVLSQFEQAAGILPVELSASPGVRPSIPSNVISLETATATGRTRSSRPNNHRRPKVWVSSAAAAVFAVGLTTTLWSRDSALRQVNVATDTAEPTAPAEVLEEGAQSIKVPPTEGEASSPPASTRGGTESGTEPAPAEARRRPNQTAADSGSQSEPPLEDSASAPRSPAGNPPENFSARSPVPTPETNRRATNRQANPSEASSSEASPSAADQQAAAPIPELSEPAPTATSSESNSIVLPETQRVIDQVQRYFQQQWQSSGRDPQVRPVANPLAYRLQLSNAGDVISFTGLDETSEAYRDRLLPPNSLPNFAITPPAENPQAPASEQSPSSELDLRIILNQNGQVEVSPF